MICLICSLLVSTENLVNTSCYTKITVVEVARFDPEMSILANSESCVMNVGMIDDESGVCVLFGRFECSIKKIIQICKKEEYRQPLTIVRRNKEKKQNFVVR